MVGQPQRVPKIYDVRGKYFGERDCEYKRNAQNFKFCVVFAVFFLIIRHINRNFERILLKNHAFYKYIHTKLEILSILMSMYLIIQLNDQRVCKKLFIAMIRACTLFMSVKSDNFLSQY